ncbi:MAG: hypothetical protein Q7R92_00230 [bacterium]|nr:hypothetical protein [bacterium]
MTLKVRRILSLIFLVLFIALTPAIMFYAAGYRLGRSGFSVQRTGMFIIDSKPRGAKIFLDGRAQENFISSLFKRNNYFTTPAKIKNILPGEYSVEVKAGGYWSWQKKLTVYPGASTFAENIYLFKNDLPALIASAEIESISLAPDKSRILILSKKQIDFLNLADDSQISIEQNSLTGKNIAWAGGGRKIVIDNFLFDLSDVNSKINLGLIAPGGYDYKWSNNTLYWRDNTAIYRLDGDKAPEKIITNKKFSDYAVKDGYLFLINKARPAASLEVFSLDGAALLKNISLPTLANYFFINPEQNLLNIYDQDHGILYLINPLAAHDSPFVETINDVKTACWTDSGGLLYANDFEIWLYDPAAKEKNLITRISNPIKQAILHPSKNYIIYATGNKLEVIELDNREKRSITELLKFDSIGLIALNPQGNTLYFSGRNGSSPGLYKLLIQ